MRQKSSTNSGLLTKFGKFQWASSYRKKKRIISKEQSSSKKMTEI